MRVILEIPPEVEVLAFSRSIVEMASANGCRVDAKLTSEGPTYTLTRKARNVAPLRPRNPDPLPPAA